MSIDDYAYIDLSPFVENPDLVVHCTTEEDARHFLANMIKQFPDQSKYWKFPNTNWKRYGSDFTFAPNIGYKNGRKLEFCFINYWRDTEPRPVIEFSDLFLRIKDYGELASPSMTIESFFGI